MSLADSIPRKSHSRYFLRIGPRTYYERGFRTKLEVDMWVNSTIAKHGLDWRVGNLVRLRDGTEFDIVDRKGASK